MQPSSRETFLAAIIDGLAESHEIPKPALALDADFDGALGQLRKNRRFFGNPLVAVARFILPVLALATAIWLLVPKENTLAILKLTGHAPMTELTPTSKENTDPASRLLIHGDTEAPDETTRWRAFWESDPTNPVWFSRYANARLSEEKTVAPDLLADARRVDPENGYWPLVAACVDADELLEKTKVPGEAGEKPKTLWHAADEEAVLHRLALIRGAAAMPRLESHQLAYLQAAIRKMPPADSFLERVQAIAWLASQTDAATIQFRKFALLVEAGLRIAIQRKDRKMAATLIRDWHHVSRALATDSCTLVGILVAHVIAAGPADVIAEALENLDLAEEASLVRPVLARIEAIKAHREGAESRKIHEMDEITRNASILATLGLVIPDKFLVEPPPPFSPADLRADRRVEAAFMDRVVIPAILLMAAIELVSFGFIWMRGGIARRHVSRQALMLLPAWKLIGIAAIAGAGPFVVYLLVTRFTPLGWPDTSFRHGMIAMSLQWATLACMMLFLPGLLAGLALEKHAAVFAWRWPGGTAWRKCAIVLLFLALPIAGLSLIVQPSWPRTVQYLATGLAGILLSGVILSLLWSAWRQRKDPTKNSPRRLAAGLLSAHARMLAIVLCAGWVAITHAEETFWAKRDTLMVLNADAPAMSSYEAKIQQLIRQQALDMLGPEWPE